MSEKKPHDEFEHNCSFANLFVFFSCLTMSLVSIPFDVGTKDVTVQSLV